VDPHGGGVENVFLSGAAELEGRGATVVVSGKAAALEGPAAD
jgi:hypothetical protein